VASIKEGEKKNRKKKKEKYKKNTTPKLSYFQGGVSYKLDWAA